MKPAIALLLALAALPAAADDVRLPASPTYRAECGSCHVPYPPQLLPAESWRALMARPQLLLLDEPSLGLAPQVVQTIFRIIREINSGGTTILLVEQNAHMALEVAHQGYVLEVGRIAMAEEDLPTAERELQAAARLVGELSAPIVTWKTMTSSRLRCCGIG